MKKQNTPATTKGSSACVIFCTNLCRNFFPFQRCFNQCIACTGFSRLTAVGSGRFQAKGMKSNTPSSKTRTKRG